MLLEESSAELQASLDELRELARGIHPAVLTDRGLATALRALADRAAVPVEIEGVPSEPLPPAAGRRNGGLLRRRRGADQRRQVRPRKHRNGDVATRQPMGRDRRRGRRRRRSASRTRERSSRSRRSRRGPRRSPDRCQRPRQGNHRPCPRPDRHRQRGHGLAYHRTDSGCADCVTATRTRHRVVLLSMRLSSASTCGKRTVAGSGRVRSGERRARAPARSSRARA